MPNLREVLSRTVIVKTIIQEACQRKRIYHSKVPDVTNKNHHALIDAAIYALHQNIDAVAIWVDE